MTENPPLLCGMQSTSDVPRMLAGVVEPPVPIHCDYCSHRSLPTRVSLRLGAPL